MDNNRNIIPVRFEKIEDSLDKFIKMKVYIANVGENYNASYFSKDVLSKMAETLPYTPLTGFIGKNQFNEIDFRAHEEDLIKIVDPDSGETDYKFKYLGFAYGLVPADPEWNFEFKLCPDGVTREYLTCVVYLWKKWSDVIDIFERDGWSKKHSMELTNCEGYIDENDKLFHFTSAVFDGLCVLGNDVEPGIPFSTIEKFNMKNFNKHLKTMFEEFNVYFSNKASKSLEGGESKVSNKENFLKKEDWGTGEKIEIDLSKEAASNDAWGDVDKTKLRNDILKASNYKTLVTKCYLIVEGGWEDAPSNHLKYPVCQIKNGKLVYNINGVQAALQRLHQEGITSGSPIDKLKKIYRKLGLDTSNFTKEGDSLSKKDLLTKFKLTAGQMFDEFNRVLSEVTYKTEDWWTGQLVERPRFFLKDYDESFVYVVDFANDCMDMKLSYTVEGDNIKIDYSSATRIKYTPVDWEGGVEDDPDYDNDVIIDSVQDYARKIDSEAKEKFSAIKQQHESTKQEYEAQIASLKQECEAKLQEHQDTAFVAISKLESANAEIEQLKAQLAELSEFKAFKLEQEKNEKVDSLIEENSKFFSVEEIDEWRNKGKECDSYESFEKEFKLAAFSKIKEFIGNDKSEKRFAFIEKTEDKSQDESDVFSRLKNKFEKE